MRRFMAGLGLVGVIGATLALVPDLVAGDPPAAAAGTEYRDLVLGDGAVHYWQLDDSGTTAVDSAGSLAATVHGGVTTGQPGATQDTGSASMSFDGSSGYIELGSANTLQPMNDFTIEAWFNTTASSAMKLGRWRSHGWELTMNQGSLSGSIHDSGGNGVASQAGAFNDGRWHHMVMVHDNPNLLLYVDGILHESVTVTGPVYQSGWAAIGRAGNHNGGYWIGLLDEFAIYHSALTAGEVVEHFVTGCPDCYYDAEINSRYGTSLAGSGFGGDPVELSSGNFTEDFVDLTFSEAVFGLGWVRSYNSLDERLGVMGPGWSTLVDSHALDVGSGDVEIREPNGRTVVFSDDGQGGYTRPPEFVGDLSVEGDGSYRVSFFNGVVWDFDTSGRIETLSSWDGQTVDVTWNGSGEATTLTSSTGLSMTLSYSSGRLDTVTSSDGRVVDYDYDANSFLDLVIDADLNTHQVTSDTDGRITELFDAEGRLIIRNIYDGLSRVEKQETASGNEVLFDYDPYSQETTVTDVATSEVTVYKHSQSRQLLEVTDADGETAFRTFTSEGFSTTAQDRAMNSSTALVDDRGNVDEVTDRAGNVTRYFYDSLDRMTEMQVYHDETAQFVSTIYRYNGVERIPYEIEDADGNVTKQTIVGGLVTEAEDADGVVTTFGYDAQRNLTSVEIDTLSAMTFGYDSAGRQTSATTAEGVITRWTYDDSGRVLTETQEGDPGTTADDLTTTHVYNDAGQIVQTTKPPTGANPITDVTKYEYDATTGLLKWVENGRRLCTFYDYNLNNELERVRAPSHFLSQTGVALTGTDTCASVDGLADGQYAITTYGYTTLGRVETITDPVGVVTRYDYWPTGDIKSITVGDGTADAQQTQFAYDEEQRPTVETDGNGNEVTTTYNSRGFVETVTNDELEVLAYEYDEVGRLVKTTFPDGGIETRTYTPAGRLDVVTGPRNVANDPTTTCTDPSCDMVDHGYDTAGRLQTVLDGEGGTTTYQYNDAGQVISEESAAGYETTYTYDDYGRQETVTGPDLETWTFEYDEQNRLSAILDPASDVVEAYVYDQSGNLVSATDGLGKKTIYGYDSRDNQLIMAAPGVGWNWTWTLRDTADRLALVVVPGIGNTGYTYTGAGQLDVVTDGTGRTADFDYDAGGRVTGVTSTLGAATHSVTYGYDLANRRTSMTDPMGLTEWSYDDAGRVDVVTQPDLSEWDYDYDLGGNLLELTYPDLETVSYSYDGNNRLTTVDSSVIGTTTYTLDADGRVTYENLPGLDYRDPAYDTAGRLSTMQESLNSVVVDHGLVYDARGRIIQHNIGTVGAGNDDTVYTYDKADQLRTATVGTAGTADDVVFTYTNGRRSTQTFGNGTTHTYSYEVNGQLDGESINSVPYTFTYDAAGRLLTTDRLGDQLTITYDERGLPETLSTVSGPDTTTETRTYDGRRALREVEITYPSTQVSTFELDWNEAALPQVIRLQEDTNPSTYFAHGGSRIGHWDGTTTGIFSYDALDNAVSTAATADFVRSETYDPFGVPTGTSASTAVNEPQFGYRGELQIDERVHLRNREFQAALGQFTTTDPLEPVPGSPVTSTPYHYADNDAINMIDPLGLASEKARDADIALAARLQEAHNYCVGKGFATYDELYYQPATNDYNVHCEGTISVSMGWGDKFGVFTQQLVDFATVPVDMVVDTGVAIGNTDLETLGAGLDRIWHDPLGSANEVFVEPVRAAAADCVLRAKVQGCAEIWWEIALSGAPGRGRGPRGPDGPTTPRSTPDGIVCNSFSEDTQVLAADGTAVLISDLRAGDFVLATDPSTGESGPRQVTSVWPHGDYLLDLDLGSSTITTTEDHLFWNVSDSEWQESQELGSGDLLLVSDGSTIAVEGLDWSSVRWAQAFDLTVDEFHSYYVFADERAVLVHNCGGWVRGDDIWAPTRAGSDPSWSTVRSRYWKNEAAEPGAVEIYGAENVARMEQGLAPQRSNPDAPGGVESLELSHEPTPARDGGTDLVERWPCEHAAVDPFRNPGYC